MIFFDYQGSQIANVGGFKNKAVKSADWQTGKSIDLHNGSFGALLNASSDLAASPFIEIDGAAMIEFKAPRTSETAGQIYYGTVLYDENKNPIPGRGVATPHNRGSGGEYVATRRMFVPNNAKYMRTTYWSPTYVSSNHLDSFSVSSVAIPELDKPFTHELPLNPDMINIIKRARQLTDIQWTPLVDISRYSKIDGTPGTTGKFLDWFKAGKEYKGIPYTGAGAPDVALGSVNTEYLSGQWGYIRFNAALDVPLEAIITAARYPNSIMGTTIGQTAAKFDSSPYGIFCSFLILYALGGYSKFSYPSGGYFYPNIESIGKLSTKGVSSLRLCDVLETTTHLVLVTDIIRDSAGNITAVEISEATTRGNGNNSLNNGSSLFGGVCRRKTFFNSDLLAEFGEFTIKRMSDMNDIPYEQSKVVSVGNEPDYEVIIDFPCIPYLGHKARYKAGYIVNSKILIGATGFKTLVVMKDGAEFGRFTITGLTEIETGFSAVGSYSAYLLDASGNSTVPCEWTVE